MAGGAGIGAFPSSIMLAGNEWNEADLPKRPGKEQCSFLARTGSCPFGPECRFDHSAGAEGAKKAIEAKKVPGAAPAPRKKDAGLGGCRGRRPVTQTTPGVARRPPPTGFGPPGFGGPMW